MLPTGFILPMLQGSALRLPSPDTLGKGNRSANGGPRGSPGKITAPAAAHFALEGLRRIRDKFFMRTRDALARSTSSMRSKSIVRAIPGKQFRMDQMRQELSSLNDTRTGTREIGICIDGVHPPVADRGEISPARSGFPDGQPVRALSQG